MKLCSKCGIHPRQVSANKGRGCYCRDCWSQKANQWNKKNKDRHRHNQLMMKFGISLEEYNRMLRLQNGVCAICKESCNSGRALAVDHDHQTKKVRGLLCGNCNRGIGNLRESAAILYRAIEYLNEHRQ